MSAQHTPGPWICSGAAFGDADGIDYTIHADGMDISKANARLITAAPDLLAALETLLAASEKHIFSDECLAERNAARAAIAKAKGGAS